MINLNTQKFDERKYCRPIFGEGLEWLRVYRFVTINKVLYVDYVEQMTGELSRGRRSELDVITKTEWESLEEKSQEDNIVSSDDLLDDFFN